MNDLARAEVEVVPDHFDAIRIMALRLERREQSGLVRFFVGPASGSAWVVEVECADREFERHRLTIARCGKQETDISWTEIIGVRDRHLDRVRARPAGAEQIALEVMSDVGALEIAGHSISEPPILPAHAPEYALMFVAASVPRCLEEIRKGLARALQTRVRDNAQRLKRDGFDFSADGWDLVVRFVWPEPPDASRRADAFAASLENFAGGRVKGYLPGR